MFLLSPRLKTILSLIIQKRQCGSRINCSQDPSAMSAPPFPGLAFLDKGSPSICCANITLCDSKTNSSEREICFVGICDCCLALVMSHSVWMGENLVDRPVD